MGKKGLIEEAIHYIELLSQHIILDDYQAVEILLAVVAAHKIPGEMLWLRLIGTPGTGKTELLNSLSALVRSPGEPTSPTELSQKGYCDRIESITPSSIRRGYVPDKKDSVETMLERIDGKLVITKELAPLLTSNREEKLAVFGLLRSVHDGTLVADYGSRQGHIEQTTHFDWILASTRYIDRQFALDALLGSRFIDLRWGAPIERSLAIQKAINNDRGLPTIRQSLAEAMNLLIEHLNTQSLKRIEHDSFLSDTDIAYIADIADFASKYRTPVFRDQKKKDVILEAADIELGTRPGQAFARIARGLALIGITDYKPYLRRLALDCLPPLRAKYLKALLSGCRRTERELGQYMAVSHVTARYTGGDLEHLGFTEDQLDLVSDNGYLPSGIKTPAKAKA